MLPDQCTQQQSIQFIAMTSRYDKSPNQVRMSINIMDVLRGVGRRKIMILGVGVLAFAIATGIVSTLKPVYTSKAQILIQNLETPFDRVQQTENQRTDAIDDRVVASQISVLTSEDLARRVVAALNLEENPEFNSLLSGQSMTGKLKVMLGFGTDPRTKSPEQRALDRYADKLTVYQLPDSNVIGIEYNSSDPATASQVANTLANIYVTWTRESQSQPTERARDWLSGQIDALRKKLAASEETVEKFRAGAGLLKGATVTLGEQEISELNTQITLAKSASLDARAKADAIRNILESRGSVESATDVLNSAAVQRLKEQRTEAMRRMSELSVTYLSNHPKMEAVQTEIASIDRQIRAEALKVVSSLGEQARIAESREQSLLASLDALKNQESTANLDDVKLKALERDAAADRVLLEALLSRYAEASARQDMSSQPGLALIIQNASTPSAPSFPKPGPMVLLITIAGFALGLGLAFLMELMAAASRLTEYHPEEEVKAEPAFISSPVEPVPAPAPPQAQYVPPQPQPAFPPAPHVHAPAPQPQEAYAPAQPSASWVPPSVFASMQHLTEWPRIIPDGDMSLVTDTPEVSAAALSMARWVLDIRRDLDVKRIGLTSLGGSAADSCVAALALARNVSMTGKRVVLVDLARVGSFVGGLCGTPNGPGIADLVSGTVDFTKVIARDTRSPIHVLRYGLDHSPRAAALLLERLESVLQALAQAYDFVVINLGEAADDTPIYLHKCQAALLLAPAARVSEVTAAVQTLLDTGLTAAHHVLIGQPANTPMAEAVREAISA